MRLFCFCISVGVLAACALTRADDDAFRLRVTDTKSNLNLPEFLVKGSTVTPDCPCEWSIRKITLRGGKQAGSELIIVDNGKTTITLIPTRGMGLLSVVAGDLTLGWESPVKEIVHPKFINLQTRGGLGWLEGFNEWMCRCGLENNGQAGEDKFINNVGDEATMQLTLHGKIANIPASRVEIVVDRKSPYTIRVHGRVDEKMFYGPKLELLTELATQPDASTFRISDVVTNKGAQPQEFEMLYHANYGRGLLEAGATLVVPAKQVTPFNANAARDVDTFDTYRGPTLGYIEQVYALRLYGDKQDRTTVLLQNKKQDRGVSMSWSLKQLPYLTQWKNTAAVQDGYVTGLEPGTNFPYNRSVERKFGRVPKLAAGASYAMAVDFGLHVGEGAVKSVQARIKAIQSGRKTTVDQEPQKTED
ncbi:MAG: aldose 1-epimerase family protein [Planctomycetota bacterium]|nr:aldose 1-epimerase family protein [Planctomycetota bacterium]